MTVNHAMCFIHGALGTIGLGSAIWMGLKMWRMRYPAFGHWLALVMMVFVVLWSAFQIVRFL